MATSRSGKGRDTPTSNQRKLVDDEQVVQEDEIPDNVVKANKEVRNDIDDNEEEAQEEVDYEVPIILSRPFLTTGKALVDVEAGELTFRVDDEKVVFHVCKSMRQPNSKKVCSFVDLVTDVIVDATSDVMNVDDTLEKMVRSRGHGRSRQPEPSESSSYSPSREASEGASVQEQPAVQSQPQLLQDKYQLRNEPTSSESTSEGLEGNNQASEPSSTHVPNAPATTVDVDDLPNDGRGDRGVEPRNFDTKVRAKKPFTWYSLKDPTNPKKKGQLTTTVGQSDEPSVIAAESADMPSPPVVPSTNTAAMPSSLSSRPSACCCSTVIHPDTPDSLEDTLKKILENQTTIMNTLVAHGSVIEELGKQVKKMRKSQSSKKSVDRLRREVTKIAAAGELPFDLLIGSDPPASSAPAAPSIPVAPAGQSEEPNMAAETTEAVRQMFTHPVSPRAEDDEIQLEETEGGDVAMDTAT
nr:uncharacterized protein LOC117275330 [Nicotiana tomentosiformis]